MEREAPDPKPKPKPALEPFPLKEHALSALENVKDMPSFKAWGARVKASQITGDDLTELREAGQQHMAKIKEASA